MGDAAELAKAEVRAKAARSIGDERADALVSLGRAAVRVGTGVSDVVVGRLGGLPALPDGVAWPMVGERPLSFLAELNLGALRSFDTDLPLPDGGRVLFFYDWDEQPWGFDPADVSGWQVVFAEDGSAQPTAAPDGATTFADVALTAKQVFTLPGWEEPAVAHLWEGYVPPDEYLDAMAGPEWPEGTDHQIGGWPSLVQGPIWEECRLVSAGVYAGGMVDRSSAEVRAALDGVDDWVLLFQIDTDDDAGWMWGDVGKLYFTAREADLRAGRFDRGWMVLQCG